MSARVCSCCRQARSRQQYSRNQWNRKAAVSRCSSCVANDNNADGDDDDDDLKQPSPNGQTTRYQRRRPEADLHQQQQQQQQQPLSPKINIRIGIIHFRGSAKITAELVEDGAVTRRIGSWRLPPILAVSKSRIKCIHVRKQGVSISNQHAMFAVALAGATKSESGVAVFKFDAARYPRYIWFCHGAVRSQFYDDYIRAWGSPSSKFTDFCLRDWSPIRRSKTPSSDTSPSSAGQLSLIPDDAWLIILRCMDVNDLAAFSRIPILRKLVSARTSVGPKGVICHRNVYLMSRNAVMSTCGRVILARDGLTVLCYQSGTGRQLASWTLPPIDAAGFRLEILEKAVALSPAFTYIAAVMEVWPGDPIANDPVNAFDNAGNPILPQPFGVLIFSFSQSGSEPFRVHGGRYRAVCFDGDDLLMYEDYSLDIASAQSGFSQTHRALSLREFEHSDGVYSLSPTRYGMVRITKEISMDLNGPPRFVITRMHGDAVCQVDTRRMSTVSCAKFFSEATEIYSDDAFEVGFNGESVLRLRCREHDLEIWDLVAARIDGEGSKTLEIVHSPVANDYLMSSSKDGVRLALVPRSSRVIEDTDVDLDELLRDGARFQERADDLADDISSLSLSSSRYLVKIYEMLHGSCQCSIALDDDHTPKEIRFLCDRLLLVRMAGETDSDPDRVDIVELDCYCSCNTCSRIMSVN